MQITRGFEFALMCMPLREWDNWKWGRESRLQYFGVGPLRIGFRPLTITRATPQ